jgi:hypothetical protein
MKKRIRNSVDGWSDHAQPLVLKGAVADLSEE